MVDTLHNEPVNCDGDTELDQHSANSGASFSTLSEYFTRHHRSLFLYARRFTRDADLAEDFVQQALLNTIESMQDGTSISNIQGWMHRCIRNLYLNYRRQHVVTEPHDENEEHCAYDESERLEVEDRVRRIVEIVALLPEHHRQAILLAEMQGLDYSEIAARMDRSIGSVSQILRRARRQIRSLSGTKMR